MAETSGAASEFAALQAVITALQPFGAEERERIFRSAAMFLQIGHEPSVERSSPVAPSSGHATSATSAGHTFASAGDLSPKEFLFEKQPQSDVERIAVLAFYLTHYRETPHFKTLDLSKLNTEAAQPKFSNAANAAGNAVKRGYLVPSTKGLRQLSAAGERFVGALPDREAARAAMAVTRPRRKPRKVAAPKPAAQG